MLRPPIDQQVTFLYTRDLANTAVFYEKTLALPLVLDQGACRIYRVSGGALGDFQASPRLALRAACVSLIAGLALALATRWSVDRLRRLYFLVITAAYLLLTWQRGALLPDPVFWGSLLLAPLAVWAGLSYTRRHSPLPSVLVMVLLLLVQLAGWSGSLAG